MCVIRDFNRIPIILQFNVSRYSLNPWIGSVLYVPVICNEHIGRLDNHQVSWVHESYLSSELRHGFNILFSSSSTSMIDGTVKILLDFPPIIFVILPASITRKGKSSSASQSPWWSLNTRRKTMSPSLKYLTRPRQVRHVARRCRRQRAHHRSRRTAPRRFLPHFARRARRSERSARYICSGAVLRVLSRSFCF